MFETLINLVNVSVSVRKYLSQSGTGVKQYANAVSILCYPVGNVVVIKNSLGKEVTSATQLYVDGNTVLTEADLITFEGREWPIEKIVTFYDDGLPDIKVVYL